MNVRPAFGWLRSPTRKQLVVVAGYALVLAIFIGLGWRIAQQMDAEVGAQRWVNHSYQVLLELRDLLTDITNAETGERGFLITGNEQYLEPYTDALNMIKQRLAGLQSLMADNARQQARLTGIESLVAAKLAELQRTLDLRRTSGFDAAATEVLTHRGKAWMDQLRQQITVAQTEEEALLKQRAELMLARRINLKRLLLLGTIACVTLLGVLMLAVGKDAAATAIVNRSDLSRYGMAVAVTMLLVLLSWGLSPIYGSEQPPPLVIMIIAAAIAAWWGGLGPGLMATGLSCFITWWIFIPPRYSFGIPEIRDGIRLVLNVFTGALISALAEAMHQAAARQRRVTAQLEDTQLALAGVNIELEQKVQQRTIELRASVEELEHFSYSITHDMRAPLRAMQGFAELLLTKEKSSLDGEEREYLRRIATAANQMDDLITDALAYSKAVRAELPLSRVDPAALLQDLLATYPDFQPTKADIRIIGTLPPVLGNRAGLTQAFSNLLRNAIKFVAPGVRPVVQVSAEMRDGQVRLWFADNGIGITSEFQGRLFKMFERASRDYEGTGIGLALVRKVAQHMHGEIGVESEPGQGSRFWIELKSAG